jgi:hypothetical protein
MKKLTLNNHKVEIEYDESGHGILTVLPELPASGLAIVLKLRLQAGPDGTTVSDSIDAGNKGQVKTVYGDGLEIHFNLMG